MSDADTGDSDMTEKERLREARSCFLQSLEKCRDIIVLDKEKLMRMSYANCIAKAIEAQKL